MIRIIFCLIFLFSWSALALDEPDHVMMKSEDIKWVEAPPSLPPGAKASILYGDPSVAGPFSLRLKLPANYTIPPHFHSQDENITVISGVFMMAKGGDTKSKMMPLPMGSFARMKAGTHHFARSEKGTVVQLNGMGPWSITYLNSADDPRSQKKP